MKTTSKMSASFIAALVVGLLSGCASAPAARVATSSTCVKEFVAGSAIAKCATPHEAPSAFQRLSQEVVATYNTGRRGD